jgi:CBS domain-containing protein
MTRAVKACSSNESLHRAAQIMWETDCGCVPVVESNGRVVGMITDRDVCMAAYTTGQPLWQIPVSSAMARQVHAVRENEPLETAEKLMRRVQVRRLPVVDGNGHLKGILSMTDLALHAHSSEDRRGDSLCGDSIARTLAAICEPSFTSNARGPH